jgi:hypothetical protein
MPGAEESTSTDTLIVVSTGGAPGIHAGQVPISMALLTQRLTGMMSKTM